MMIHHHSKKKRRKNADEFQNKSKFVHFTLTLTPRQTNPSHRKEPEQGKADYTNIV